MTGKRILNYLRYGAVVVAAAWLLPASEHHGLVKFGGLPVPGATVTATRDGKTLITVTDPVGAYAFPDLADGTWTIQVEMPGFAILHEEVGVAPQAASPEWALKMLSLSEIKAVAPPPGAAPAVQSSAPSAAPAETKTSAVVAPAAKAKKGKKGLPAPGPTNTQTAFQRTDVNAANTNAPPAAASEAPAPGGDAASGSSELSQRASDGFLINGTQNNGASSAFAQAAAFGNNRRGPRSLYNGNVGLIVDNSSLDARPYSVTGQDTGRPSYNHMTGVLAFGGPIKIPYLLPRNGPNFFFNYQWMRSRNDTTVPGLVPSAAERGGDFSQVLNPLGQPVQIVDPTSGTPFSNNVIPQTRISPQAQALLALYPLPNFPGSAQYNYQVPLVSIIHQDSLQSRINKAIGRKNQVSGTFAMQSTRTDNPNLFGFLDRNGMLGLNAQANWRHNFSQRLFTNFGLQYSRFSARLTPFYENRTNVAGLAGITGNNQEPVNWGPPTLNFSGISPLSDGFPSFTRNQTSAVSADNLWNHGRHSVSFGGDYRKQQVNLLSQQDPRGTFIFTGAATRPAGTIGSVPYDFADFLVGVPDASTIAFGNADKYFRASIYEAYVTDDWKVSPGLTLSLGVRWEYWSPMTEKYGRLVNLDLTPGFTGETPVTGNSPLGTLTGQQYPNSLIRPDKHAFQPRIGFSWRPLPASSMVVRGGYGVYYNTSIYQSIATSMAQQAPFSKSLSVQNGPDNPLTLANGFNASPTITENTFAVDPNLRVGYVQTWQLSVQRDLPGSLVVTAMYLGTKGTRGLQEFLPNTYPQGVTGPCPACPVGFYYLTSNGNSTRESGQLAVRRRLHNGFTASLQYTYAKAIDDAALGGRTLGGAAPTGGGAPGGGAPTGGAAAQSMVIAQNWLDLSAERGRSNFDQRHQATALIQYTSGMGIGGGTLVSGWKGVLLKQWTFTSNVTAGTGLPLTPTYFAAVSGTGVQGTIRPEYTGQPLYAPPAGYFLNPAAYGPPLQGQWGNAGRNSITGPSQFSLGASMGRTFQLSDRMSLDLRVDATNVLNHVTFASWNTTVGSGLFGLPNSNSANAMRSLQTNLRLRF